MSTGRLEPFANIQPPLTQLFPLKHRTKLKEFTLVSLLPVKSVVGTASLPIDCTVHVIYPPSFLKFKYHLQMSFASQNSLTRAVESINLDWFVRRVFNIISSRLINKQGNVDCSSYWPPICIERKQFSTRIFAFRAPFLFLFILSLRFLLPLLFILFTLFIRSIIAGAQLQRILQESHITQIDYISQPSKFHKKK